MNRKANCAIFELWLQSAFSGFQQNMWFFRNFLFMGVTKQNRENPTYSTCNWGSNS